MRNVHEIYREYSVHQLRMRHQRNAAVREISRKVRYIRASESTLRGEGRTI